MRLKKKIPPGCLCGLPGPEPWIPQLGCGGLSPRGNEQEIRRASGLGRDSGVSTCTCTQVAPEGESSGCPPVSLSTMRANVSGSPGTLCFVL